MALPPWTVDLLRRGVADLARQATDPETAQNLKDQASKLVEELPRAAREKVDTILKQAEASAAPFRDAWAGTSAFQGPQSLINGAGNLSHERGSGVAVDPSVLAAAAPYLMGDCSLSHDRRNTQPVERFLSEPCGTDVQVLVVNSFDAGLSLIGQCGRRAGRILVPRCCAVPLRSGSPACLADELQRWTGGAVREVGTSDGIQESDLVDAMGGCPSRSFGGQRTTTLVRLPKECCTLDVESRRKHGVSEIVVAPSARLLGASTEGCCSAAGLIRAGADAALIGGGVLTGTPGMGILIGRSEWMKVWNEDPRVSMLQAPDAMAAMLNAAALLACDNNLPVDRLIAASESNLQDRAERLATQLSGIDGVTSAVVTQDSATMPLESGKLPSRQVLVRVNTSSPAVVVERLTKGDTCLLVEPSDDGVAIDLRWVTPDQQAKISQLFAAAIH
ncbi:PLP-dependent aminotransferase family protein [Rhodopirellula europaea]|uniref:L-seryl-tRNA(Sec) selenium transferase n=1 Tax=Rhodopirellula europaea 6C TaxID=1263867 RepID=M2AQ39_9BACT|nr:hypothetical protein [Rhodopirellula europaea]EMB19200.1 hypothetical protein RE6C_00095 [Rhodopirellula europaea 6C]